MLNIIENLNKNNRDLTEKLIKDNKIGQLILFNSFYEEYGKLIMKILKTDPSLIEKIKDDVFDFKNSQRIIEAENTIREYEEKRINKNIGEDIALRLSRVYSSWLEILWGRFKRIIYIKYPELISKNLNLRELKEKISDLEKEYFIKLDLMGLTLEGLFRNGINHETTYFELPNIIVFLDRDNDSKMKEIDRLTLENIVELLLKIFIINSAVDAIEKGLIISRLEVLLKLNDDELKKICETGILTKEMQEKINKK